MNFRKQKPMKFLKQVLVLLLFLVSCTLYNCVDTETLIKEKIDEFRTASLFDAKLMLLQHKRGKVDVRRKVGSALVINPKWETIQYESLSFTDALVTKVEFDANIEIQETSKLFFIEVNNTLVIAIKTDIVEEYSADNKMKEGKIFFHDLDGNYLDGYVIKKGKIKSKLVPKKKVQEAGFLALLLQLDGSGSCDGSLTIEQILAIAIENGGFFCFEEVEIGGGGSGGGSSGSNTNGDPTLDPNSGAYINFLDGASEGNSGGGSSSGSGSNNEPEGITNSPLTLEDVPPNCSSFNYSRVGSNNWQVASVSNVHELFILLNWSCIGFDWGIFKQPLYFQLPINYRFKLNSGNTKTESAILLHLAFEKFDIWYQSNGCSTSGSAMEQKLLNYIKDEFEEEGGNVTLSPPLGYTGTSTPYQITYYGYGNCN